MSRASYVASRTASKSRHFFNVHPRRRLLDDRGVIGQPSILQRAKGFGGRRGIAFVLAAIVGAITLMHMARMLSTRRGGANQSNRLNALRSAILGVQKKQIAAALGPPRATIGRGNFLTDNTWYYPLDPRQRLALAIEFDAEVAKQTQVIPGVPQKAIERA